jgi:hypothetical protein
MFSPLNAFSGLSAANIATLFRVNSSTVNAASAEGAAQSAASGALASAANDPANAIKAILAQARIAKVQAGTISAGSTSIVSVSAAYADQTDGSRSIVSGSVAVTTPGAVQQIDDAVALVNKTHIYQETEVDPATHNGISAYIDPITVTANDAVNVTISNGIISAVAMDGATFPDGLPSIATIQQTLNMLKADDESTGWNGVEATAETTAKAVGDAYWDATMSSGSFTLIRLPPGTLGAWGGNLATFSADGLWSDDNKWALVLPQVTISATMSETQIKA